MTRERSEVGRPPVRIDDRPTDDAPGPLDGWLP